jgi:hypothetical protein
MFFVHFFIFFCPSLFCFCIVFWLERDKKKLKRGTQKLASLKIKVNKKFEKLKRHFFKIIFASTIGTLFQLVPAIPIELVKTKLQTQCTAKYGATQLYTGPMNCAYKIVQQKGFKGLYQVGSGGNLFFTNISALFLCSHKRAVP